MEEVPKEVIIMVMGVLWTLVALIVDAIAIGTKAIAVVDGGMTYFLIGAPLQVFTGIIMSYYLLYKHDTTAFRLKKQLKRIFLQVLPIPLVTTAMWLYLWFRHNHPKLADKTKIAKTVAH